MYCIYAVTAAVTMQCSPTDKQIVISAVWTRRVVYRLNVPLNTLYVISGTIFTGHMTKPTVSKYWRKPFFHQDHSTMLQ